MENICKLTGVELNEQTECPVKKMCLNCISLKEREDGVCTCTNETVMEYGKGPILKAVPEGYEIETLTLKPMVLKFPTKKCKNYAPNKDLIESEINKIFEVGESN